MLFRIILLCTVIITPWARAQTTLTYDPDETDSAPYDTTDNDLTLAVASGSATQSGALTGTGQITKTGAGTLIFSGPHSYTGDTTINGGTLAVAGAGNAIGGTTKLFIGHTGDGALSITNGAQVTPASFVELGHTDGVTGTLNLDGSGSQLSTGYYLDVGFNGTGELNITNGASLTTSSFARFGVNATGVGTGLVSGTGSALNVAAQLELGTYGHGTLTIANGGTVSTQALRFDRLGGGHGTLNLNDGGTLVITSSGGIENYGTANDATLNLAGGTLKLNAADFTTYVGANLTGNSTFDTNGYNGGIYGPLSGTGGFTKTGSGVLTVTNNNTFSGAVTVNAGTLVVNTAPDLGTGNGDVTVNAGAALAAATNLEFSRNVTATGTNAIITSANHLEVGSAGDGAMTISNGGLVGSGTTTTLAYYGSDTGTIDVTGTNATLYAQTALRVGYGGTGTLNLGSGGTANAQNLILAAQSGSTGTINVNTGGTLQVGGTDGITIGSGTGTFNLAGGTLKVGGDARVEAAPPSNTIDLTNLPDVFGSVIAANTPQAGDSGLTTGVAMNLSNVSTIDTNTSAAVLSGVLSGTGALTKAGAGTLTLSGANTYTGTTTVNAGTLVVNGSLANTAVSVADGAILSGSGSIGGPATFMSGATLAPGNSPGTLTFTNGLTLNAGAILNFELGTTSDLIAVTGGMLTGPASGTVTLNLADSGGFTAGSYTLFDYTAATLSDFDTTDFALGTAIAGYDYSFNLTGTALQLIAATAVPEPSTYAMIFGLGACLAVVFKRRRMLGFALWRRRVKA